MKDLKIIRTKETSQIAVVTGSKQNKWGESEQYIRHEIKRGNIGKTKLMSLQQTVRTKTLETCIEE
jgi:hypothetical protein